MAEDIANPLTFTRVPRQPSNPLQRDAHGAQGQHDIHGPYRRLRPLPSPKLQWHKDYDSDSSKQGRVLLIDYVKKDYSREGTHKVAAQEIADIDRLRRIYTDRERDSEAVLRIFHVQNAPWAVRFLLRKFNIQNSDTIVGTDFDTWVRRRGPQGRSGKPTGRAWRTQHDPWRSISRTSFGCDYFKAYSYEDLRVARDDPKVEKERMMELNSFDSEDNARPSFAVFSQRLSIYIQHKDSSATGYNFSEVENPYEAPVGHGGAVQYLPNVDTLDNGNTIIIFENSQTSSVHDTLISARKDWESRWRRLPFYLSYESVDVSSDEHLAIECMKVITQDIFTSITDNWASFLELAETHVGILEDRIYSTPADETRAAELWTNNYQWMKVEKLVATHQDNSRQFESYLEDLLNYSTETVQQGEWLPDADLEWNRLSNIVQEGLVKPTANLADLMYKSVGFRDSRLNLELSTSVWRLTWIATLFLPLTFVCSFFGMNVDTFNPNNPSIKWYFIASVPLLILVFFTWWLGKHILRTQLQNLTTRSVYNNLYIDLAASFPQLWTQTGPRNFVNPRTWLSNLKWRLVLLWTKPEYTIKAGESNHMQEDAGLGTISRIKRTWLREWTQQIATELEHPPATSSQDSMLEMGPEEPSFILSGMSAASNLLALPGEPHLLQRYKTSNFQRSSSRHSRASSDGKNEILVEEKDSGWLGKAYKRRGGAGSDRQPISPTNRQRSRDVNPELAARNISNGGEINLSGAQDRGRTGGEAEKGRNHE